MSTLLLESGNLSVTGYHYKPTCIDEKNNEVEIDSVHIDFNFLINWKIKRFWWSFMIEYNKDSEEWELIDYQDWNVMYSIIIQLWYSFSHENDSWGQSAIKHWISTIMM